METLLAHESVLSSLPAPDKKTLKAFKYNFFHGRPHEEESFPILGGPGMRLYDDGEDLVVLRAPERQDRLSILVQDYLGCFFRVRSLIAAFSLGSPTHGERIL